MLVTDVGKMLLKVILDSPCSGNIELCCSCELHRFESDL